MLELGGPFCGCVAVVREYANQAIRFPLANPVIDQSYRFCYLVTDLLRGVIQELTKRRQERECAVVFCRLDDQVEDRMSG